jgi:hypothetical protein
VIVPSLNCPSNYFQNISEDDRLTVLRTFLNIPAKNEEDLFLRGLTERENISRHRSRKEGTLFKMESFRYYCSALLGIRVCSAVFFSLCYFRIKVIEVSGVLVQIKITINK